MVDEENDLENGEACEIPPANFDYTDFEPPDEMDVEEHIDQIEDECLTTRHLANFILKTKEDNRLSEKALFDIMDETSNIVEQNLSDFKRKIHSCFRNSAMETSDVHGLEDLLLESSHFSQTYKTLCDKKKLRDYMLEDMQLIVSSYFILTHTCTHTSDRILPTGNKMNCRCVCP